MVIINKDQYFNQVAQQLKYNISVIVYLGLY